MLVTATILDDYERYFSLQIRRSVSLNHWVHSDGLSTVGQNTSKFAVPNYKHKNI